MHRSPVLHLHWRGAGPDFVRLWVGIEDVADIEGACRREGRGVRVVGDLEQGLEQV
jgi:hypothetical protein